MDTAASVTMTGRFLHPTKEGSPSKSLDDFFRYEACVLHPVVGIMSHVYYLVSNGRLRRKDNTIVFERTTEDGTLQRQHLPIETLDELYLFGQIDMNMCVLTFLSQHHIPVHFFNYYGYYTGTLMPRKSRRSGKLVVLQVQHYVNQHQRLVLAREFVRGALMQIAKNLQYYASRGKPCKTALETVTRALEQVSQCTTISSLMQIEGNARKAYYGSFNTFLNLPQPYQGRTRRPPQNQLDAALSFGYGLLYSAIAAALYRTKLDPTIGYLHEPSDQRLSLALDVAELFKPLLVERMMFRLLNRQQLCSEHFTYEAADEGGGVYLNANGRALLLREWTALVETSLPHHAERAVSYRQLFYEECIGLVQHLQGRRHYAPFQSSLQEDAVCTF